MSKDKSQGQGQQKRHTVLNPDGTPYRDPETGEEGMTQEQWRNRDKTLGLPRPEGEAEADGAGG
jgi:hypothetical protein